MKYAAQAPWPASPLRSGRQSCRRPLTSPTFVKRRRPPVFIVRAVDYISQEYYIGLLV